LKFIFFFYVPSLSITLKGSGSKLNTPFAITLPFLVGFLQATSFNEKGIS
jgi:hypothetical protein